jgi:LmbE family N-acetylglucosaminyl deacetylase
VPGWEVICLSPHADDAALSLGGTLARLGPRALVATLCGGPREPRACSPFAEALHARMGVEAATIASVRRAEDETALARLGVARLEAGFDDAIYRGYDSLEVLLGGAVRPDDPLAAALDRLIAGLDGALVLAPLAAGGHVDHVQAFAAARRSGRPVAFYEDFPYVAQHPGVAAARVATERLARFSLGEPPDLEARIAAVLAYRSQLDLLFGGPGPAEAQIRANPEERLWR